MICILILKVGYLWILFERTVLGSHFSVGGKQSAHILNLSVLISAGMIMIDFIVMIFEFYHPIAH